MAWQKNVVGGRQGELVKQRLAAGNGFSCLKAVAIATAKDIGGNHKLVAAHPGLAGDFVKALFMSKYFYVVAVLQIAGGALLLLGRFVPLGLTLLGPVIVNILLFHIFLDPAGLAVAIVVGALALFLLWAYRSAFSGLIKP